MILYKTRVDIVLATRRWIGKIWPITDVYFVLFLILTAFQMPFSFSVFVLFCFLFFSFFFSFSSFSTETMKNFLRIQHDSRRDAWLKTKLRKLVIRIWKLDSIKKPLFLSFINYIILYKLLIIYNLANTFLSTVYSFH